METKFFEFNQMNSGGSLHIDNNVTSHVYIEAINATHANSIAEEKGIYFNGVEKGIDCKCCGDRWNRSYGEDNPYEIYDQSNIEKIPLETDNRELHVSWRKQFRYSSDIKYYSVFIYHLNGDKFGIKTNRY